MKTKAKYIIILITLVLSSCVSSSPHAEIIGKWQDTEVQNLEIEFTPDGRFIEYFFGEKISVGEYRVDGRNLLLHYLSKCGEEENFPCDVKLGYTTTEDTLIITDTEGDIIFKRVE